MEHIYVVYDIAILGNCNHFGVGSSLNGYGKKSFLYQNAKIGPKSKLMIWGSFLMQYS